MRLSILVASMLALLAGGFSFYYFACAPKSTAPENRKPIQFDQIELKPASKPFLAIGCNPAEIEMLTKYNFVAAHEDQEMVEHQFEKLQSEVYKPGFSFLDATGKSFNFPQNIIIGYIRFGETKPIAAEGKVVIRPGKRIFYESYCLREREHFIDYFKPGDLQGIELTTHKTVYLREVLKTWKNLESLSFFNSLTKVMPGHDVYDESKMDMDDLKITSELPRLTTLGVCGRRINGEALMRLPVMTRLKALRVKRISNYEALLTVLPRFANLQEIWLLTLPVTDEQLEPLTHMPALESLNISRAAITPASIAAFARMPRLKNLRLNVNWSTAQMAELRRKLPACRCILERPVITEYWQTVKKVPVAEYFKDQETVRIPDY
jgi:hypothetical protein